MRTEDSNRDEQITEEAQQQRPRSAFQLHNRQVVEADFKVKQLKSQLYYMLTENDNLKEEVNTLKSSITSVKTRASSEHRMLTDLQQVTRERDEALKNLFLTRQLMQFFKHKEETGDLAFLEQIFILKNQLQSKENLIKRLNNQIAELKQGKRIVDKYIVEPSLIVMQLQSQIQKLQLQIQAQQKQVQENQGIVSELQMKLQIASVDSEHQKKLATIAQEQAASLRKQLVQREIALSTIKNIDKQQLKDMQQALKESETQQQRKIDLVMKNHFEQTQALQSKLSLINLQPNKHNDTQSVVQMSQTGQVKINSPRSVPIFDQLKVGSVPVVDEYTNTDYNKDYFNSSDERQFQNSDADLSSGRNHYLDNTTIINSITHQKHKEKVPVLDLSHIVMGSPMNLAEAKNPAKMPFQQLNNVSENQVAQISPKIVKEKGFPVTKNLFQPQTTSDNETSHRLQEIQKSVNRIEMIPAKPVISLQEYEEGTESDSIREQQSPNQYVQTTNIVNLQDKRLHESSNNSSERNITQNLLPNISNKQDSDEDDPFALLKKGSLEISIPLSNLTNKTQPAAQEIQVKQLQNIVGQNLLVKLLEKEIEQPVNQPDSITTQLLSSPHNKLNTKQQQLQPETLQSFHNQTQKINDNKKVPSLNQTNQSQQLSIKLQTDSNISQIAAAGSTPKQTTILIKNKTQPTPNLPATTVVQPQTKPLLNYEKPKPVLHQQQTPITSITNQQLNTTQHILKPNEGLNKNQKQPTFEEQKVQKPEEKKQKQQVTPIQVENPVVDEEEYYEEESEDESNKEEKNKAANLMEELKREELRKLRALLRQNKEIPKVIIIQDAQGNEIEYEVLEESEAEETGRSRRSLSLRAYDNPSDTMVEESVEYYEEVIEESEEETDSVQSYRKHLN